MRLWFRGVCLLFRLAELYRGLEKWKDAKHFYEDILKKFPKTDLIWLINYGLGYLHKAQMQYKPARKYFEAVIKNTANDITNSSALVALADIDFAEGEFENSVKKVRIGFKSAIQARYIKFVAFDEVNGAFYTSVGELTVEIED